MSSVHADSWNLELNFLIINLYILFFIPKRTYLGDKRFFSLLIEIVQNSNTFYTSFSETCFTNNVFSSPGKVIYLENGIIRCICL